MKNNLQLSKGSAYQWGQSLRHPIVNTDIKVVINELRQIEKTYGEVTPLHILEASKRKNSVLHDFFEWDDGSAAHKWRLTQARYLLAAIEVKVIREEKPVRMRAYQITKSAPRKMGESTYTKFDTMTEENILYVQRTTLKDLVRIKNKLDANGLDGAIPYIDKALKIIQKELQANGALEEEE